MLNMNMEFRKGILFIRLSGSFNKNNYQKIKNLINDFKYVVLNVDRLRFVDINTIEMLEEYSLQKENRKLYICNGSNRKLFNKFECFSNELEAYNLLERRIYE